MRGRFVTWAMGAVCVPLIAGSAFVLAAPLEADRLLSSSEPPPAPLVPSVERVPVSLGAAECAVVGVDGTTARRLDGTRLALGAGTVLEGVMSARGREVYRARIMNGPHVDEKVELQGGAATRQGDWGWGSQVWACTWMATAELDGLWEDAARRKERERAAFENETEGVLWDNADEVTARLMRWARRAPELAYARARMEGRRPMSNEEAYPVRWFAIRAVEGAAGPVLWAGRVGGPEPTDNADAGELALR